MAKGFLLESTVGNMNTTRQLSHVMKPIYRGNQVCVLYGYSIVEFYFGLTMHPHVIV